MISEFRLRVADFKFKVAAIAVLLTMVILLVPVPFALSAPQERHVRIEASQFQYMPSVISVNPGDGDDWT